jgi:hypothetical protein
MKNEQTCSKRYDRSKVDRDLYALRALLELMDAGTLVHATSNRERHYIKGRDNNGMRVHIQWHRHQGYYEAVVNALSTKTPQHYIQFTIDDVMKCNFLKHRLGEQMGSSRRHSDIPTSFDKIRVNNLDKPNLLKFYWKVVNALDQDATDEEHRAHDDNLAYLVWLIGYDPIC